MGKMVCSVCQGGNIEKNNDYFVCQDCGCKYSLEEARNLFGRKSDSAFVQVSPQLEGARRMGDEAYSKCLFKEAFDYYTKVVELDGTDYERKLRRLISQAYFSPIDIALAISELDAYMKAIEADTTLTEEARTQQVVASFSMLADVPVAFFNTVIETLFKGGKTTQTWHSEFITQADLCVLNHRLYAAHADNWMYKYPQLKPFF